MDNKGNDITSQVTVFDYQSDLISITKCACGAQFEPWGGFTIPANGRSSTECPGCGRKMYGSIQVRIYEVKDD